MADMQVAIGLGRKARNDFSMLAGLEVAHNNIAYKIARRRILFVIQWNSLLTVFRLTGQWILSHNANRSLQLAIVL